MSLVPSFATGRFLAQLLGTSPDDAGMVVSSRPESWNSRCEEKENKMPRKWMMVLWVVTLSGFPSQVWTQANGASPIRCEEIGEKVGVRQIHHAKGFEEISDVLRNLSLQEPIGEWRELGIAATHRHKLEPGCHRDSGDSRSGRFDVHP